MRPVITVNVPRFMRKLNILNAASGIGIAIGQSRRLQRLRIALSCVVGSDTAWLSLAKDRAAMRHQRCRRGALQQRHHALKRDLRLRVVGQKEAEVLREVRHEGQVVDEEREVAYAKLA